MEATDSALPHSPAGMSPEPRPARRTPNGVRPVPLISWTVVVASALYFVAKDALHYYHGNTAHENYPTLVGWIRLHVTAGMGALFAGLAQLRTGLRGGRWPLHRMIGRFYLGSIVLASIAATALLAHPNGGWVTASGLAALVVAWLTTTGLAYIAIRRGNIAQHREWMIRSYVVTFAFVNFRILYYVLGGLHVGTWKERTALSSWCAWAAPLLITELVLQGRKVFASPRRPLGAVLRR